MELTLNRSYIEERYGGLYVVGKRVSLDSVLHEYKNGALPESIVRFFPVLDLEDVYGFGRGTDPFSGGGLSQSV